MKTSSLASVSRARVARTEAVAIGRRVTFHHGGGVRSQLTQPLNSSKKFS